MTYLVMLCHTMDDLPVGLFKTREEAVALANQLDAMPSRPMRNLFGTDCSTPCCVKVVAFDARGIPTQVDVVREFNDDDDT